MAGSNYYIGLMSGTSLDGIDACIVEIGRNSQFELIATLARPYPDQLRSEIRQVSHKINDHLHALATLDQVLADYYAETVRELLKRAEITPNQVKAIGSHGQTVRHCPDCNPPYTIQLGNPPRITALTGITTVADFRQQDMAAGGQGAPLAPGFHQFLFAQEGQTVVALNLGGIANISILHSDGQVTGHDTGPANTLMDQWISRHTDALYDEDGRWATSGDINQELLDSLLHEPWLKLPPPKSTGPELFNLDWLDKKKSGSDIPAADVQRTLCEYTAVTIGNDIKQYAKDASKLILCGGGAHNRLLCERLEELLPGITLVTSDEYGIGPDWIESAMFAWLAHRTLKHLPGNVPAVTGADREMILGAIYSTL